MPAVDVLAQCFEQCEARVISTLQQRRIGFVLSNLIVPTCLVSSATAVAGTRLDAAQEWVPAFVVFAALGVLTLANLIISGLVLKCHRALVRNGLLMLAATAGEFRKRPLNLRGIGLVFYLGSLLWAGIGSTALAVLVDAGFLWQCGLPIMMVATMVLLLVIGHESAVQEARREWEALLKAVDNPPPQRVASPVSEAQLADHAKASLEETQLDLSVVVTMAVALFVGVLTCLATMMSANPALPHLDVARIRGLVSPWLILGMVISLTQSAMMVVRLRVAVCDYAPKIQRGPWQPVLPQGAGHFKALEMPLLLYLLLILLLAISVAVLLRTWWGWSPALGAALAVGAGLMIHYVREVSVRATRPKSKEDGF